MSGTPIDVPVLVAGAGPVGLALACELGSRGVRCLVIDQGDGSVVFPAGEAVFVRNMEHLRRWGIAERIHQSGFPQDYQRNVVFCTRLMGYQLARFERDSAMTARAKAGVHSPEAAAYCPKVWFDPMLRDHLRTQPHVQLEYGWRLDSFEQDADGVVAQVTELSTNRRIAVRSRYLAACDGAKSSVRRSLGIEFEGVFAEGHNLGIYLRAKDLLARQPHGNASQFLTISTRRRASLTTVNGKDLWRLSLYVQPGEAETLDPAECVRDAFGADLDVEILRAQPWAGHRVVARSYRSGRVFLAGDAAHMLWPKGGFGANTGIGDAVDLGWKLSAVLAGWGGERLLESYEAERRPIGVRNVEEAASNRAADGDLPSDPLLEAPGPEGDAARKRVGETILATRWKEWNTLGVQLGYRYANSPVIVRDGTPQPPDDPSDYVPSTWPGCRAPHAWLAPGRSTLDLFGHGFVLLRFGAPRGAALVAAAQRAGMPLETADIADASIAKLYAAPLVLVRPDGHVAWRGGDAGPEAESVIAQVRGASEAGALPRERQAQLQN
jgi:2-polyprenyl-6-methoxyphenol hydroxylase-like FAD-dependent oxidoreductase